MRRREIDRIVRESLQLELEAADKAGTLAYMARILVLATMPHSKPKEHVFKRQNGKFRLYMMANPDIGLPYGTIPRLTLAWASAEAMRTKSRTIELGDSLSEFMRQLDMVPTGGRWGSITRLREQMKRLFSTSVSCSYDDAATGQFTHGGFYIADRVQLWWDPKNPEVQTLWKSTITLGERFYKELTDHPVPLDMRVLKVLRRSPMALDIYTWLTYRMFFLREPVLVPWALMELQFGADYAATWDFRCKFLKQLRTVKKVYPEAKVEEIPGQGIKLSPSPPSVAKLPPPAPHW